MTSTIKGGDIQNHVIAMKGDERKVLHSCPNFDEAVRVARYARVGGVYSIVCIWQGVNP